MISFATDHRFILIYGHILSSRLKVIFAMCNSTFNLPEDYLVARNFCGSIFLRIGNFLCFAGTYFCGTLEKSGEKRNNCVPHGSASKEIQDNQKWLTSHSRAFLRYGVTVGSLCHPKIYSDKLMLKCIYPADKK